MVFQLGVESDQVVTLYFCFGFTRMVEKSTGNCLVIGLV